MSDPRWVREFRERYEDEDPIVSGEAVDDLCDLVYELDAIDREMVREAAT